MSEYTIKNLRGCRIVIGSLPMQDFSSVIHGFSDNAIMATDIASLIGATLVIGEPEDIERLRQSDLPISEARKHDAELATKAGLPSGVVKWLSSGERGRSSEAMCHALFGIPDKNTDHPRDPDDLRRCLKFVDALDQDIDKDKISKMSDEWSALMESWDELLETFKEESTEKTAPKTYSLMKDLEQGKRLS